MSELSEQRLAEIEERARRVRGLTTSFDAGVAALNIVDKDIPDLITEVRRLRAENERHTCAYDDTHDFGTVCSRCHDTMVHRAESAEAREAVLRAALEEVAADDDPRDGCAHSDRAKSALTAEPSQFLEDVRMLVKYSLVFGSADVERRCAEAHDRLRKVVE